VPGNFIHEWVIFALVVAAALALDLLVFHREEHEIGLKEAALESAGWIGLALAFNGWVYYSQGREAALQFLTAYVVEKSLSIDNIFLFVLIFSSLRVPPRLHHTVLFYGVAGALLLRGLFVWAGVELLRSFHPIMYVFAAILLITAARMLIPRKRQMQPERNWLVRLVRLFIPVTARFEGDHFFVKENGRRLATSLFVALIVVEAMDIVFAADSVPAVLAISRQPFIAYSSNAFAILGLRALYFAVSAALSRLRYLHQGLAAILIVVAGKMIVGEKIEIPTAASLGAIALIMAITVVASLAPWKTAPTGSEKSQPTGASPKA
jgi:tellurite resistance protein TerC